MFQLFQSEFRPLFSSQKHLDSGPSWLKKRIYRDMNEEEHASPEMEMVPIVEEAVDYEDIGEFGDRKTTNIVENGQKEAPMASLPLQPKQLA